MRPESPARLALGLGTGAAFGFLLQKGRVGDYETILGQLRGRDYTVAAVMATASAVGAVGVHALASRGATELDPKPVRLGGLILGGLSFGAGMAVMGYCPGTSLAAVGAGRKDALAGVLGMLAGAAVFVGLYPELERVMNWKNLGKATLPQLTGTRARPWIAGLAALAAGALAAERRTGSRATPRESRRALAGTSV
jgi:uncharacterized membrane protein YedE/YeeE